MMVVNVTIWLWLGASGAALLVSLYPLWEAWQDWRVVKRLEVKNGRLTYTTHVFRGQFLKSLCIFLMILVGLVLIFIPVPRPEWMVFFVRVNVIAIPSLLAIDAWYEHWYRLTINRTVK